jgi:hypothetical protein
VITPFLMSVFRSGRAVLFTGIIGNACWTLRSCQPQIRSRFGQANNLRRLVLVNDDSHIRLLALPMAARSQAAHIRFAVGLVFSPLHGLRVSRAVGEMHFLRISGGGVG